MIKKLIAARRRKIVLWSVIFFSVAIVGLGLTPHTTCGCGGIENGSKLTYFANKISNKIIGKPVFKVEKKSL